MDVKTNRILLFISTELTDLGLTASDADDIAVSY
jgi:hypothetical protein